MNNGLLVIFSGPSGAGKDTLLERLRERDPEMRVSLSLTTRAPREGEVDGVNYSFVSREHFESMIESGKMLEYAEYNSNYYGTPKDKIDEWLGEGRSVFLKIEVQGAEKMRKIYPSAISIFVMPPSLEKLIERLCKRGSETQESLDARMKIAIDEINRRHEYNYTVINDDLDEATEEIMKIIDDNKN